MCCDRHQSQITWYVKGRNMDVVVDVRWCHDNQGEDLPKAWNLTCIWSLDISLNLPSMANASSHHDFFKLFEALFKLHSKSKYIVYFCLRFLVLVPCNNVVDLWDQWGSGMRKERFSELLQDDVSHSGHIGLFWSFRLGVQNSTFRWSYKAQFSFLFVLKMGITRLLIIISLSSFIRRLFFFFV